ncbi:MAG: hypothetical protein K2O53_02720, partial [Bacteroidales bacterium]|nr:hypothetical protein [Bacteroidales bacterium]
FYGNAWSAVDLQNIISVITKDNASNINTAERISGKSPVMYLIEGETGTKVLTVQYDYAINGDEWIYQIKAYENGNVELVVKNLETAHVGNSTYRLFIGLVENGNYTVTDDEFAAQKLNIVNNYKHYLGITQDAVRSWDDVQSSDNTSTVPDGLFVQSANAPAEGRTLRFTAPADCAAKAQKFKNEWYGFSLTTITKSSFTGKITFDTKTITADEMLAAGSLVAVLSTSETPDYTLDPDTYYRKGDKIGDATVLINTKGGYSQYFNSSSEVQATALNLTANGLTGATPYYIHIYAMDYSCTGAPVYSDLCRTVTFTTSLDLPQTLTSGLPTTSAVPLTVKPADGLGMILLKSPNTNALSLSGKYEAGDKIGDAEVLTVITEAGERVYNAPLKAGEGAYILAYSVKNPEAESPLYGQDCLNLPVRAAYDTLPKFRFDGEALTPHKTHTDVCRSVGAGKPIYPTASVQTRSACISSNRNPAPSIRPFIRLICRRSP